MTLALCATLVQYDTLVRHIAVRRDTVSSLVPCVRARGADGGCGPWRDTKKEKTYEEMKKMKCLFSSSKDQPKADIYCLDFHILSQFHS